jgi:polyhydroxyalkanoate synthesis regulator phasin
MMPNAEQMSKMARDTAEQWKLNSPELRKQMQEFEKQMEEQQREWEKNFEWSTPKQL